MQNFNFTINFIIFLWLLFNLKQKQIVFGIK